MNDQGQIIKAMKNIAGRSFEQLPSGKVIWLALLLCGCSPVPINVLRSPPTNEVPPQGYKLYKSYDFANEIDRPPTGELDVCEVWGVDHISRKDGGMWNPDGTQVPANDPRNFCEWNPDQVKWIEGGYLALVTDLNDKVDGTPVVSGLIATITSYMPPVYIAVRMKVPADGGTYWPAFLSYSPSGWLPERDFQEFECSNSKSFTSSIHDMVNGEHKMTATKKFKFPVDLSESFHLYSAKVEKNRITIYLDNIELWDYYKEGLNIESSYYLVGNAIFQGCDPDLISPEKKKELFPKTMIVDWIKIYKP